MLKLCTVITMCGYLLMQSSIVQACSVCFFGDPNDAQNKGLRAGIMVLMGVLLTVMFCFIKFLINFRRRSQRMA